MGRRLIVMSKKHERVNEASCDPISVATKELGVGKHGHDIQVGATVAYADPQMTTGFDQ